MDYGTEPPLWPASENLTGEQHLRIRPHPCDRIHFLEKYTQSPHDAQDSAQETYVRALPLPVRRPS